jgi:hypothetical protein
MNVYSHIMEGNQVMTRTFTRSKTLVKKQHCFYYIKVDIRV